MSDLQARWIWRKQQDYRAYNTVIVARKDFSLGTCEAATIKITADSWYRLRINDQWVADGPCRAWPEHYQYDVIDVRPYLRCGRNRIEVVARYFGVGTFHQVPRQAGLLVQLDVRLCTGQRKQVVSDRSWLTASLAGWIENTPKISIQMGPAEWFDARIPSTASRFKPAVELYAAGKGPWKGLQPRDVALLTLKPVSLKSFLGASVLEQDRAVRFCFNAARLVHPGLVEANYHGSGSCGLATVLKLAAPATIDIIEDGVRVAIDGREAKNNRFRLGVGEHLVLGFVRELYTHAKEKMVGFRELPAHARLINPLKTPHENPWCLVRVPEGQLANDDMVWIGMPEPVRDARLKAYHDVVTSCFGAVKDLATFRQQLASRCRLMPSRRMFEQDSAWSFVDRRIKGNAAAFVDHPAALMHENAEFTIVKPVGGGDVELVYDLGEQDCGYYDFELEADAGVIVDIQGVEYIFPDGRPQHTAPGNRNGLRYVTRAGLNRYTSVKRRSQRFVYLTLRNLKAPVRIRRLGLVESTYPVEAVGAFRCSDERLTRIWDISARTLKLCMEDVFVDCPLYEQTLWVGDARNESIFALDVFGARDMVRRCILIAGQSLERYPMVGCQVPSGWDCILPAWSFLWGISVWDYAFHSGDVAFLRRCWPMVMQNLRGAAALINRDGLFSKDYWNLFDWAPLDQNVRTVVHNSLFMIGAINAALHCAEMLADRGVQTAPEVDELKQWRRTLRQGVRRTWDRRRRSFVDSIHDDGTPSPSTSQHTNFLGVLYGAVDREQWRDALKNLTDPPAEMVKVGSPFAMMFLYEALDKVGKPDLIVRSILDKYVPMLEEDATTVWETFPGWERDRLTRSHCHAWSSAPLHFLTRIVLGIRQTQAGGMVYEISPRLNGLTWARGAIATVHGRLAVEWKLRGRELEVQIRAPTGVMARFVTNETLKGFRIRHA